MASHPYTAAMDALALFVKMCLILLLLTTPLAIWKLVDLAILLGHFIRMHWGVACP